MTALCRAWTHSLDQPMRLVSALISPGPLLSGCPSRNNNFPCYCRTTTRLSGSFFSATLMALTRPAGEVPLPLPTHFFEFWFAQLCMTDNTQRFLGATSSSSNTAGLAGFAEALGWAESFIPHGEQVRILLLENTLPESIWVTLMLEGRLPWPTYVMTLFCGSRAAGALLVIIFRHAGMWRSVPNIPLYPHLSCFQHVHVCKFLPFCLQSLCTLDRSPNALTLAQGTP